MDFELLSNQINDKLVSNFTWYLYVLLLENDFYYIGVNSIQV